MLTRVDVPFLDREATVTSVDHLWSPTPAWNIRSQVVASSVRQGGTRSDDSGFQVRADQELGDGWRHQAYLLHLGDELQLNDIGFLDRNDFNYLRYELARRYPNQPEDSAYASHEWRWAA